jgi:hypothetical protein
LQRLEFVSAGYQRAVGLQPVDEVLGSEAPLFAGPVATIGNSCGMRLIGAVAGALPRRRQGQRELPNGAKWQTPIGIAASIAFSTIGGSSAGVEFRKYNEVELQRSQQPKTASASSRHRS